MEREWENGQTLPNVQEAEIDARKFEQYSLNPENPSKKCLNQGKGKMKANIYDRIVTLVDVYTDFGKRMINKGTQGTIVECYENSEGYAIDLAIPDDRWIGGFDYENVILTSDQFELTISPVVFSPNT